MFPIFSYYISRDNYETGYRIAYKPLFFRLFKESGLTFIGK